MVKGKNLSSGLPHPKSLLQLIEIFIGLSYSNRSTERALEVVPFAKNEMV